MDIQKLIREFITHYGDLSGQEHLLELFANCVMAEYARYQDINDSEVEAKAEQPPQTPSPSSVQTVAQVVLDSLESSVNSGPYDGR